VVYVHLSPHVLLWLATLGVVLIYAELCAPGRVLPGVLGGVLLLASAWALSRRHPTPLGIVLLLAAAALFIIDAWLARSAFVTAAATAFLAAGLAYLIREPERIPLWAAISSALLIGLLTGYLGRVAARARRNKRLSTAGSN
jgi:membrane-bound ClpP family serine protease